MKTIKFKPIGLNYDLAKEIGLNAAIIFHHISYHIVKNEEKCLNIIDGTPWTTITLNKINERFPFLTFSAVRIAMGKILKAGLLKTGNFNTKYFQSSKSYTLTEKGREAMIAIDSTCAVDDNESLLPTAKTIAADSIESLSSTAVPIIGRNKEVEIRKKISSAQKRGRVAPETTSEEVKIATVPVTDLTTLLDAEPDQSAKDIAECIHLFTPFNPNIKTLYGNKTQRKAAAELLEKYGLPWMQETMVEIIGAWRDGDRFVPKVHNPWLFLSRLADIQDWRMRRVNKEKEEQGKKRKAIFVGPGGATYDYEEFQKMKANIINNQGKL